MMPETCWDRKFDNKHRISWILLVFSLRLWFNCQNVTYFLDCVFICNGRCYLRGNLIRLTAAGNSKIYFKNLIPFKYFTLLTWCIACHRHHHHHLPPWVRSFDLFWHRRIAIVSWGVHNLFFLEVCSWGRVSGVWCCPFFQGGWFSFVCIWVSRLVFQRSLVLSLTSLLILSSLVYPVTLLRKRISAASRRVMS